MKSILKLFPEPVKLMKFFQGWTLSGILAFYEVERQKLGEYYCEEIDQNYKEAEGKANIENYLRFCPSGFKSLLEKCNDPSLTLSQEELTISDIERWLADGNISKRSRTLIMALSKGFLTEWIIFCAPDDVKTQFLEYLRDFYVRTGKDEKKKWKEAYKSREYTRNPYNKLDGEESLYFYFVRRILQGHSLDIIFRAVKFPKLRLHEKLEDLKESMHDKDIDKIVQDIYIDYEQRDASFSFIYEPEQDEEYEQVSLSRDQIESWNEMKLQDWCRIEDVTSVFANVDAIIKEVRKKYWGKTKHNFKPNEELEAFVYSGFVILHVLCLKEDWKEYSHFTTALTTLHGRDERDQTYFFRLSSLFKAGKNTNEPCPKPSVETFSKASLADVDSFIRESVEKHFKKENKNGERSKKVIEKETLYIPYAEYFWVKFNKKKKDSYAQKVTNS